MRFAYVGPMPGMTPEPRYFSRPAAVFGSSTDRPDTRSCAPCCGSVSHVPVARTVAPVYARGTRRG
ncbi:MAG: hypothetical protein IPK71_11880 [Myxococcales bacterium]|nr:hypothetical protein [Myxococcales bacterium]